MLYGLVCVYSSVDSSFNIQGDQIKSLEFQNTRSMNEHIGSSTKIG